MRVPDLSQYRPHRVIDDIPIGGVPVPGLRAEFFRRDLGDRVATVGRYRFVGREIFQSWGYAGEPACRFSALRGTNEEWEDARPGCPEVRALSDGDRVLGLALRSARGTWVVEMPLAALPPATEPADLIAAEHVCGTAEAPAKPAPEPETAHKPDAPAAQARSEAEPEVKRPAMGDKVYPAVGRKKRRRR